MQTGKARASVAEKGRVEVTHMRGAIGVEDGCSHEEGLAPPDLLLPVVVKPLRGW